MILTESYNEDVTASTETADILLGTNLQTAPMAGIITIYGRHEASVGTLVMNAQRNGANVLTNRLMQAAAGGPNKLEDTLVKFSVDKGDRILIKLKETAGTNTIAAIVVEFVSF